MKFRLPELLLGCLLTVAVFSIGLMFASSFPHEAVSLAHPETVDDRLARYTGWLALLTGALVLASLVQFYFLYTTTALAREEFIATHRPRVIVRFIQGPYHDDDGREFYWVTFANVGETAATVTEIGGDLVRRNIETGRWREPGIDASPKAIVPITLESGQRHTVTVVSKEPVSESDLFGDATGTYELCAVGRVRYQDRNSRTRETAFFRVTRSGAEGAGFVASSNSEDEYED